MAYKLLCCVLPVDIVNKVSDYNICSDKELHMHKALNVYKIKLIGRSDKDEIDDKKKFNYKTLLIVSLVPKNTPKKNVKREKINEYEYKKYNNKKNKCYRCYIHLRYGIDVICLNCVHRMRRDVENLDIIKKLKIGDYWSIE